MKIIAIDTNGKRGAAKEKLNQGFDVYLSAPIKQADLYNSLIELSNPDIINVNFHRGDNKKRLVDLPQFKARVLVVEDNIVNQKVAAGILKKFGLTIDVAGNGAEAITANAMQGAKELCLKAGMNDFVSKPISVGKLSAILSNWFEHKKLLT